MVEKVYASVHILSHLLVNFILSDNSSNFEHNVSSIFCRLSSSGSPGGLATVLH